MELGSLPSAADVTLVDITRSRAERTPGDIVFTFLDSNLAETELISYRALDEAARRIAARLQRSGAPGDRVLLVFSSGADFIKSVFGCFYAGRIAVPVSLPQSRKPAHWKPLENLLRDADAGLLLTDQSWFADVFAWSKQLDLPHAVEVAAVNDIADDANDWQILPSNPGAVALLQYTSGSTGMPKGVVLTHRNLCLNSELVQKKCFQLDERAVSVSWLPHYHNMGLIGYMLSKFYAGARSVLMSPSTFLTKPVRWLEVMSRYRGTMSAAPNFAYDLCTRVVTDAEMASLDLSAWQIACLGGEPIREETLRAFARKFAACGFREEVFCPCYGLAEATLIVTTVGRRGRVVARAFDQDGLTKNRAQPLDSTSVVSGEQPSRSQRLVGVGPLVGCQEVTVVNPELLTRCGDGEIGEIWISGPSIAAGYWRKPAQTEQTFAARLAGESSGPYLRTGDLGFVSDGELYITGRLKDLIIVRGRNHYPQDIELTVQRNDPTCQSGAGVAFAVDHDGEERLVVVQEIAPGALEGNFASTLDAARRAIVEQHEIQPHAVVLIRPGTLPKTPSGKVQRRLTKEMYLAGQMDVIAQSTVDTVRGRADPDSAPQSDVERQVAAIWAEVLNLPLDAIGANAHFLHLGGDSLQAKRMLGRLRERYAVELPLRELFESPTVAHTAQLIELCRNDGGTPIKAEEIVEGAL